MLSRHEKTMFLTGRLEIPTTHKEDLREPSSLGRFQGGFVAPDGGGRGGGGPP